MNDKQSVVSTLISLLRSEVKSVDARSLPEVEYLKRKGLIDAYLQATQLLEPVCDLCEIEEYDEARIKALKAMSSLKQWYEAIRMKLAAGYMDHIQHVHEVMNYKIDVIKELIGVIRDLVTKLR